MLNITAHIIAFPKPEMYWQFGQNGLYINVSSGITNSFNELIIYLLSGKTTNECRKYWILPTPL
jgi:hypothetical protein